MSICQIRGIVVAAPSRLLWQPFSAGLPI